MLAASWQDLRIARAEVGPLHHIWCPYQCQRTHYNIIVLVCLRNSVVVIDLHRDCHFTRDCSSYEPKWKRRLGRKMKDHACCIGGVSISEHAVVVLHYPAAGEADALRCERGVWRGPTQNADQDRERAVWGQPGPRGDSRA